MPRIRTLKPEALTHRKVGPLTDRAFRLWVACLTQADDHGRLVFDASQFRVLVWGYHVKIRPADVAGALLELVSCGLCRAYLEPDEGPEGPLYVDFPSWTQHQRVDRPSRSHLPAFNPRSVNGFEALARIREDSRAVARARGGSEGSEGSKDRKDLAHAREGKDDATAPDLTGGPARSSLAGDQDRAEDRPPARPQARSERSSPSSSSSASPIGAVLGSVLSRLAPAPAVGSVPRAGEARS